jgi:hypothetical protein
LVGDINEVQKKAEEIAKSVKQFYNKNKLYIDAQTKP